MEPEPISDGPRVGQIDDGGLAGRWWYFWTAAGDNFAYIGAAIVGLFLCVTSVWWTVMYLRRRSVQTGRDCSQWSSPLPPSLLQRVPIPRSVARHFARNFKTLLTPHRVLCAAGCSASIDSCVLCWLNLFYIPSKVHMALLPLTEMFSTNNGVFR